MKHSSIAGLAAAAVAALGLLGWAFAPRPIEVETASAAVAPFVATVDEDGRTRLRDRYVVSAPLAGRVARVALREGDRVDEQGVVAVITPLMPAMLDSRARREQELRVEAAGAQVQRAEARVGAQRVALEQARLQLARSEALSQQGFVAASKLDVDRLGVAAAAKELEVVADERHAALHELEQARAALVAVQQADAGPARAFAVRSPAAGSVLHVLHESEGALALGTPLVELGDVGRLEVVAELLTTDAVRARPGSRVLIERWGGDQPLEGRVRLVEPGGFTKVSALGVEEQRVDVVIDLTSPRAQWEALGDGFRVGVRVVTLSLPKALQVPVSAVFPRADGAGMAVFKLVDGRAREVPVKVGERNGVAAWITDGLQAGDTVVVYPPAGVRDGARARRRVVAGG
jgi:HlyD family secretion protein